jgi:hypothetical protein
MSRWANIIIHHSGTQDSDTMSWDNIKHYHKYIKGWDDIGYHFGGEIIEREPTILVGRPLYKSGAHCIGYNHNSIGFMICGDFNDVKYSPVLPSDVMGDEALTIYAKFLAGLCVTLNIPVSNILPHSKADTMRTCPGKYFPFDKLVSKVIDIIEQLP